MKIVYVGQLYPAGNISTALWRMQAIESFGHTVTPMDVVPYSGWGGRVLGAPFRKLHWGPPLWRLNNKVIELVSRHCPDVLWVDKGVGIFPETLRHAREEGVCCAVHYTPDPAFLFHGSRHFVKCIPSYDLLVTTKGYEVELYRAHGARRLIKQFAAFTPSLHQPTAATGEEKERYASDVVFLGTYALGREEYLRPLCNAGVDLAIWGNNWERSPDRMVRQHVRGPALGGRDYPLALSCTKIGLGLLSPVVPDSSTTRSFEIPACGCFFLAPRTDEHCELYSEGVEAEFFESDAELVEKVQYYLAHDEERSRIAAAGYRRCVGGGNSYRERMLEIIEQVTAIVGQ